MRKIFLLIVLISFTSFSSRERYYNQVQLSQNNTIANFTQMNFLDTVVSVALDHEGIKDKLVVIDKLSDRANERFSGELKAMLLYNNSAFYIFIDEHSHEEAITTISHELIHMNQYLSGDLVVVNEQLIWKGENWNFDGVPYEMRPWEVEAFENQSSLEQAVYGELIGN